MAHIIDYAMSMEIDSIQPGIQLNNEDRAQYHSNYSMMHWAVVELWCSQNWTLNTQNKDKIKWFLLSSMLWHRQAIFKSKKGDKLSSSAECRIWTSVFGTESPADWIPADKLTKLSRIKLKNLNSTARPYDQRAFSPLDPTSI